MTRDEAKAMVTAMTTMRESATDAQASLAPAVYPGLKQDGGRVTAGTRINHNGVVYKAAVTLWDTPGADPDSAPTLWEKLAFRDGYRIIPETITVTSAFAEGELGWWGDVLYRSKVSANVYTPEQYPDNWEVAS